jgi:hydrogenase-4 membrane subunit HyfE
LLILLYISKCYILLLNEVIYWKKFYKDFLLFEVISLSIFIIIFVFSITFKLTIDLFILNLSIFYVSKFLFKFFVFTKKNEKSKNYLE